MENVVAFMGKIIVKHIPYMIHKNESVELVTFEDCGKCTYQQTVVHLLIQIKQL